ncbi:hypothetical protein K438DRAFT_1771231 [Mycena galopus ATCC 62051]|nr:hypothetical protein K438DRAFT_1771231 [Mycena galopus ATCC 62051]
MPSPSPDPSVLLPSVPFPAFPFVDNPGQTDVIQPFAFGVLDLTSLPRFGYSTAGPEFRDLRRNAILRWIVLRDPPTFIKGLEREKTGMEGERVQGVGFYGRDPALRTGQGRQLGKIIKRARPNKGQPFCSDFGFAVDLELNASVASFAFVVLDLTGLPHFDVGPEFRDPW